MKFIDYIKRFAVLSLCLSAFVMTSCGDDEEPEEENLPEVITDVTLVFTNTADASDVVQASAQDPDGEGIEELEILGGISLDADKTYELTYVITNSIATDPDERNIGAEIAEEDDEHQLFFAFTDGAFTDPMGNGNIDNAADPINYNDEDGNGNPVGLSTTWTTRSEALAGGVFTARLQHQPDVKTSTSGATDGDTDFDLTFVLTIE